MVVNNSLDNIKTWCVQINTSDVEKCMTCANVGTGLVETGLNISLIKLTKDLMATAGRCEEVL